MEGRGATKVR